MPLYEYQCDSCGHRFERIQQKFSDPLVAACPKCGGPVQKLISSPAIQFKGSGFYITDYAKSGQPSKDAPTDGSAAKEPASSEKPAADKPAAAAEKPASSSEPKAAPATKTPPAKSDSSS